MSLHNHITPQEYLKHFAAYQYPERIWRYDKRGSSPKLLPIKATGQRKDFHPLGEERRLFRIEKSASPALNQLRDHSQIDEVGRVAIGNYLATMLARTERTRSKMADYLSEDIASLKNDPEVPARMWKVPMEPMLKHLEELEERLLRDNPLRTKETILNQALYLPDVLDHIVDMNWQVFTAESSERFLTSDNPVFVGTNGLKPPRGEFLFPLASESVLVGSWQSPKRRLTYRPANLQLVKGINRYTVSGADRWLYFHQRAGWVIKVIQNPSTKVGREPL